ncbi:cell number regulator 5-like [Hibiscus syriacus]|uniref:cell number regulator 5-like n=1 Tax=Hibiscus syriacus TaxID=106335 RepID=UPI00192405DF|nr:cell number regulator 5-like [Hibiscus syriacus]
MAQVEKQEKLVVNGGKKGGEEEEEEKLLEGMAVLDFDVLCSTVALQTQGKWSKLETAEEPLEHGSSEFGGVFRMWEGEVVLDFLDDRRLALESACCPCYRFGKNMRRAGFGFCFLQGTIYFILTATAILNFVAFIFTKRNCFLYLGVAFIMSVGAYLGFFRTQIKRKFNIRGSDSFLDDCVYHLICPCCTLSQESRTLEMNNVLDGTWHGRGDICIERYAEGRKPRLELHPPPPMSIKTAEPQNSLNRNGNA